MPDSIRILFVEDSSDDAELQVRLLRKAGYSIAFERVDTPSDLRRALERTWDLIISDYSMPTFKGLDALHLVRKLGLETPFIFVSGTMGEETAVAALKMGAQDYLMKNNLGRLIPAVERELREAEDRQRRKLLERQVHRLQRFEAIGRLAGGVAHDFNNVIGAIMGWAEMGSGEAPQNSVLQDRFLKIRRQAERAAGLTRQLLAFARRQILQPAYTDLNELVREEIALLKNVIGEHNVVLVDLAEGLPAIWADPSQIEQVVMNLCLNARDAMPHGGELKIRTQSISIGQGSQLVYPHARPGSYILLSVADTGVGIDSDALEHVFEPFFTTKEKDKGTGLGLATVYGVVKQHDGFIEVDSAAGVGTTFRVYLPAAPVSIQPTPRVVASNIEGGCETVLIAEDNEDVRESTRQILEKLGYKVLAARDGAEAVEIFRTTRNSVDLVLLDMIMPNLSGPEAAAQISDLQPSIPLIFATGYATESSVQDARSLERAVILQKPFDTAQLAQKLREALSSKA